MSGDSGDRGAGHVVDAMGGFWEIFDVLYDFWVCLKASYTLLSTNKQLSTKIQQTLLKRVMESFSDEPGTGEIRYAGETCLMQHAYHATPFVHKGLLWLLFPMAR